jgi:DNA-binding response OmpR family regulator
MTLFDYPIRARSHDDLLEAGWGGTERLSPALVRAAAVRLRRKLAAAGSSVRIDAVRGFGFLAAVEERS